MMSNTANVEFLNDFIKIYSHKDTTVISLELLNNNNKDCKVFGRKEKWTI